VTSVRPAALGWDMIGAESSATGPTLAPPGAVPARQNGAHSVSQRLTHRPPTEPGRKPARPAPEPEQVALAARRSMQLGVAMVLTMLPTFASFPARMLT